MLIIQQINQLKADYAILRNKYADLKAKYYKSLQINMNQSITIMNLEKSKKSVRQMQNPSPPNDKEEICYGEHFSEAEWNILETIPQNKENDATYIRKCLEILYKSDLSILIYRSLNGCSANIINSKYGQIYRSEKYAITPEKRMLIRGLFHKRINKMKGITDVQRESRICEQNFNSTFARCINNIQRSISLKQFNDCS